MTRARPHVPVLESPGRSVAVALTWTALMLAVMGCGAARVGGTSGASGTSNGPQAPAAASDDGASLWAQRGDPAALQRAIELWSARLRDAPADLVALLWLERGLQLAAVRDAGTVERARALHERGVQAAEAAFAQLPSGAPATTSPDLGTWLAAVPDAQLELLYWYAQHRIGRARHSGLAQRAFDTPPVRQVLEHCRARRPELDHGGPDRVLGGLYARPTDATLADLARSRAHFEAALRLDAAYPDNHLSYARDYAVAARDWSLFDTELDAVIHPKADVAAHLEPEAALAHTAATALQQRATELFE